MDRKSITIIVACIVLIFVWTGVIMPKMYPNRSQPQSGTNIAASTTSVANAVNNTSAPVTETKPAPAVTAKPSVARSDAPEQTLVVTNENARLTFTSQGGGIKEIELVKYPEKVTRQSKKLPLTNGVATLNAHAPAPVLTIIGDDSLQ